MRKKVPQHQIKDTTRVSNQQEKQMGERMIQCKFCGKTHLQDKLKCPAWGKQCGSCGKQNHFAVTCRSKSQNAPRRRTVHTLEADSDSDEYVAYVEVQETVSAVDDGKHSNKLLATMILNGVEVKFQLDSGATVNLMPEEIYKRVYGEESMASLDKTDVTLVMYNKAEEKPVGKKRVRVINPKNGKKYSVEFIVTKGSCKPLLGARATQQMHLISVIRKNILAVETPGAAMQDSNVGALARTHNNTVY